MWVRITDEEFDKAKAALVAAGLAGLVTRLQAAKDDLAEEHDGSSGGDDRPRSVIMQQAEDEHTDSSCDIEIDPDAAMSRADKGTWVQGWLWCPGDDEEEDEKEEEEDEEAEGDAEEEQEAATVICTLCHQPTPANTAHLHQDSWIGECCWDERLRASE